VATVNAIASLTAESAGAPAQSSSWRVLLFSFPPAYVVAQISGWGLYAAFWFLIMTLTKNYPRPINALVSVLLLSVYGFTATHLIRAFAHKQNWIDKPFSRFAPLAIIAAYMGGVWMSSGLFLINSRLLGLFTVHGREAFIGFMILSFYIGVIILFWEFFYFLAKTIERRRAVELQGLRLELLAREAQYRALSSQLQPHFLFNCLNSLRALITEDPARARDMVTDLAGFLRHALDHDLLTRVTLGEELAALDRYLALEHMRFEDRLHVHQEIPSELLRALLPPMMLQTLVENGLKHGIARLSGGGEIAITAVRQDGVLEIDVLNDGILGTVDRLGCVGLRNTRERLALVYSQRASLELFAVSSRKVCARLRLPYEEEPPGEKQ
jgi:hypothetical protein